ncbi:serine protease [Myxococcus qinghaiensis]|uniref:serine protease n=1 Tax=Myxococcus qinghaiensis TaxID=2906758 RepID=UPI0020A7BCED|nr:serine protease [Myxococcus qinghaiensis]MCP3170111.1 serine protease [Myxococcus qinghaiensis]
MRFVLGVVVAVGLLGCGGPEEQGVDAVESIGQEIVGGVEARPGAHPWNVSLQQYGSHFCGASLIRVSATKEESDIVVTAAHCVYDGTARLTASAGVHDLNRPGAGAQTVNGVKTVYHPAYNPRTTMNDIAVVKLEKPLKFSATVQPILLPLPGEVVPDNVEATVAGWGLTRENGQPSSVLLQVGVPTIGHEDLRAMYSKAGIAIDRYAMLGAGYRTGGKDACQGDSGGPLFLPGAQGKPVLQGIVSFGIGCARAGMPGVYTRVSNYIPWINTQVRLLSDTARQ